MADMRNQQLEWANATSDIENSAKSAGLISLIDTIIVNLDFYNQLKDSAQSDSAFKQLEEKIYEEFDEGWENYQGASISFIQLINNNRNEEAFNLLKTDALDAYVAANKGIR